MRKYTRALLRVFAVSLIVIAGLIAIDYWQEVRVKDQRHEEGKRAAEALDLPEVPSTTMPLTTTTTTEPPASSTTQPAPQTTTTTQSTTTSTTASTTMPPTTTTVPLPTPPQEMQVDTAFGDVSIERLGLVEVPLYEGNNADTDKFALDHGVAHRPGRGLPGSGGNVVIGGHRTSRHAPFYSMETLLPEDQVVIRTTWGVYIYSIEWVQDMIPAGSKAEQDALVAQYFGPQADHETVTLFACTPRGKVSHRIIALGRLVSVNGVSV